MGDINGDGLEDFILGGASGKPATIFLQNPEGKFEKSHLEDSLKAKYSEDMGVLLFDADGDGDLDLYCVSGSSEFLKNIHLYQDRLYAIRNKIQVGNIPMITIGYQ